MNTETKVFLSEEALKDYTPRERQVIESIRDGLETTIDDFNKSITASEGRINGTLQEIKDRVDALEGARQTAVGDPNNYNGAISSARNPEDVLALNKRLEIALQAAKTAKEARELLLKAAQETATLMNKPGALPSVTTVETWRLVAGTLGASVAGAGAVVAATKLRARRTANRARVKGERDAAMAEARLEAKRPLHVVK